MDREVWLLGNITLVHEGGGMYPHFMYYVQFITVNIYLSGKYYQNWNKTPLKIAVFTFFQIPYHFRTFVSQ